jgi:hypothetical protein
MPKVDNRPTSENPPNLVALQLLHSGKKHFEFPFKCLFYFAVMDSAVASRLCLQNGGDVHSGQGDQIGQFFRLFGNCLLWADF